MATTKVKTSSARDSDGSRARCAGLQRMVDDDVYCIDILTQITAASNALKKVAVGLLEDHIRHCVARGDDDKDMVREAAAAIERLVKA